MFTIDCILHFHTVVLLSCSLHSCMHLACWIYWPHAFWTETNKIYKRETWGVCKKASPILDLQTSTSNILKRRGKKSPDRQRNGWKKRKKNRSGRSYVFTRKHKRLQGFLKTSYFKNVYSTGALSQLISALISEATIPEFNERYFWIWKNIYKGIN